MSNLDLGIFKFLLVGLERVFDLDLGISHLLELRLHLLELFVEKVNLLLVFAALDLTGGLCARQLLLENALEKKSPQNGIYTGNGQGSGEVNSDVFFLYYSESSFPPLPS